jgi:exportin-T
MTVSLTPDTLALYKQVLQQQQFLSLRGGATKVLVALASKGMKNPAEKLQVLHVLDLVSLIDPIEAETREAANHDPEILAFRTKLAGLLSAYGEELIAVADMDETEAPEMVRADADNLLSVSMPLVLRFLSDRHPEVPTAISQCVSDLLRTVGFRRLNS